MAPSKVQTAQAASTQTSLLKKSETSSSLIDRIKTIACSALSVIGRVFAAVWNFLTEEPVVPPKQVNYSRVPPRDPVLESRIRAAMYLSSQRLSYHDKHS